MPQFNLANQQLLTHPSVPKNIPLNESNSITEEVQNLKCIVETQEECASLDELYMTQARLQSVQEMIFNNQGQLNNEQFKIELTKLEQAMPKLVKSSLSRFKILNFSPNFLLKLKQASHLPLKVWVAHHQIQIPSNSHNCTQSKILIHLNFSTKQDIVKKTGSYLVLKLTRFKFIVEQMRSSLKST
ncbi:hypothetical protein FGO68_gene6912 [Halteria grandinella]|uniref:Uncharacterized protein n=1 Tax=Halteria grandinella TaxID=5974 RepID=A0A8J8NVA6_HALGN|nr:hypothetical protein FGO68_gene6912 [Halteria grandinella]